MAWTGIHAAMGREESPLPDPGARQREIGLQRPTPGPARAPNLPSHPAQPPELTDLRGIREGLEATGNGESDD